MPLARASAPHARTAAFGVVLAALVNNAAESADAGAPSAQSDGRTPTQWLHAMDIASRNLDYDGVFSYYTVNRAQHVAALAQRSPGAGQGQRERTVGFGVGSRTAAGLATYRVVHKVVDGVERERIVHLNGPPREIVRAGDKVHCVLQPGDELLDLEGSIPLAPYARVFARRFENMSEHYHVEFGGHDRVVARPAVRLAVLPHDDDRFGYRLWLDEETGLLLRSELHDFEGASLEIFQFTSLKLGEQVAAADLDPAADNAVMRRLTKTQSPASPTASPASPPPWRISWVPAGFHLTSADYRQPSGADTDGTDKGVDTLVYSDGLAAFSVFIEAMPEAGAGSVVSRSGATVVLTHLASGGDGDHLVTVVGEVPIATARRVASGIARQP